MTIIYYLLLRSGITRVKNVLFSFWVSLMLTRAKRKNELFSSPLDFCLDSKTTFYISIPVITLEIETIVFFQSISTNYKKNIKLNYLMYLSMSRGTLIIEINHS